jgi:hypothetical protein
MGKIVARHSGDGTRRVIHIRDAHCDVRVQERINEMLVFLRDRYDVDVINLEGGEGAYDPGMFTAIEDPRVRKGVSEVFLRSGVLNGAEFTAINSRAGMHLWGVEDRELYRSNLDAYLDTAGTREKALGMLDELDLFVQELAGKVYGPELLAVERAREAYSSRRSDLIAYIGELHSAAGKCGIQVRERSQAMIFRDVCRAGEKIDFQKADEQRDGLIGELRRDLSISEARELDRRAEAFARGEEGRTRFHEYLSSKAGDIGITKERYPDLFEYIGYLSLFDGMDPRKVEEQAEGLFSAIEESLCREDAERHLLAVSRGLRYLRSLFSLRLDNRTFREYEKNRTACPFLPEQGVLERLASEHDMDISVPRYLETLDVWARRVMRFYVLSSERDRSFVRNLRYDRNGNAVLITGGFHSEGVAALMRKNGISYVSIMPACDDKEAVTENNYNRLLSGGLDPVAGAVGTLVSSLSVPSMLTDMAQTMFPSRVAALRCAVDINRRLLESGSPVTIVGKTGKRTRFSLSDGEVIKETDAGGPVEGEIELGYEALMKRYHEALSRSGPGRTRGGRSTRPGIIVDDGIARLMTLLRNYAQTEEKDIPSVAAIPDLHASMVSLEDGLSKVDGSVDEKVFLGDILDRGDDNLAVAERVMRYKRENPGVHVLMGNHDMMFILAMMGDEESFFRWLENGGTKVMKEIGIDMSDIEKAIRNVAPQLRGYAVPIYNSTHPGVLPPMHKKMMGSAKLREISDWMQANMRLFHLCRNGGLYTHTIMPMDAYGRIVLTFNDGSTEHHGLAALAKLEEHMRMAFREDNADAPVLQFLAKARPVRGFPGSSEYKDDVASPLWVRYSYDTPPEKKDLMLDVLPGSAGRVLDQLGCGMMVLGHTPVRDEDGIKNIDDRIFFLDRYHREQHRNVLINNAAGLVNLYEKDSPDIVMDGNGFKTAWEIGKARAEHMLTQLTRRYGGSTPAGSDLMGKLYDGKGNICLNVAVSRVSDRVIRPYDAVTGKVLYDRKGERVEELKVSHTDSSMFAMKRFMVMDNLNFYMDALEISGSEDASVRDRIFHGARRIIMDTRLGVLDDNPHGIIGIADLDPERPFIYLDRTLTEDIDVLTVALFHEAAGVFLARNPELVPAGTDAHKLLRGASRRERLNDPDGYVRGIQDEIFGDLMNGNLTYYARLARGEHLFGGEARLINALYMLSADKEDEISEILGTERENLTVSPEAASHFIELVEEDARYRKGRDKEVTAEGSRLNVDMLKLQLNMSDIRAHTRIDLQGEMSPTVTLRGSRALSVLNDIAAGATEKVRILPSPAARRIEGINGLIEMNRDDSYRNGAVADLPSDREIIIVGDLHTRIDNLKKILSTNGNLRKIREGRAVLLILGDAPHCDPDAFHEKDLDRIKRKLKDMGTSVEIMDFIFRLRRENGKNVQYILGNHDFLTEKAYKMGIHQGTEYKNEILRRFGAAYVLAYDRFIRTGAIMARTDDGLVCTHAGPVKSARSMRDIREARIEDDLDNVGEPPSNPVVHEALWSRWGEGVEPYDEEDVARFHELTGARTSVVSHSKNDIPRYSFHKELIPGTHHVTFAAKDSTGYLSYRDGKITPVAAAADVIGDSEETPLAGEVREHLKAQELSTGEAGTVLFSDRVLALRDRLGYFGVAGWLGKGSFGTAVHVITEDGRHLAIKIAGHPELTDEKELARKRTVVKATDVMLGIVAGPASGQGAIDYLPRIVDAGVHGGEPYIVTEKISGHEKLNSEFIRRADPGLLRECLEGIAGIFTALQNMGAIMFDPKPENFVYHEGRVMLLDTGSCMPDANRLSNPAAEELKRLDIHVKPEKRSDSECYENFRNGVAERFAETAERLDARQARAIMDRARREGQIRDLYSVSADVLRDIRFRQRPVAVLLQQPRGMNAQHFAMLKKVERRVREEYGADDLRVISYDGTPEGLDRAMGKASDLFEDPRARAVAYIPPELYPENVPEGWTFIKEQRPEDGVLPVVAPHVAFALGLITYQDGAPSEELLRSMADMLRTMTSDRDILGMIGEEGVSAYIDGLIRGLHLIRIKKLDTEDIRNEFEMREQLLTSM